MIKNDCFVFDFGCSRIDDSIKGDCNPDLSCSFQTPVPNGLGPIVVACLYKNLFTLLNER
jgi:5,10-methylene-tetrahydrofolate dehydrogenase/methenyl tetrahydrofolate cyclohydrolase